MSHILKKTANLTPEQKRALLTRLLREKANGMLRGEPSAHRLFEAQASRAPDATAVVDADGRSLTYAQLDHDANQLAHRLRSLSAGPNTLVALCTDRSPDMLVALLAVLKAGAAYLPLDPEYPRDRLEFMLRDSGAAILLTQQSLKKLLPDTGAPVVLLDDDRQAIERQDGTHPPDVTTHSASLAYVIYTSGSTGKPKGVMIPHDALTNFILAMRALLGLEAGDSLLAVTTLSFDIAVLELFVPLIVGARIQLASRDEAGDGQRLAKRLHDNDARFLQATPATWRLLLDSGWQGKPGLAILCGGEAMTRELAERLIPKADTLWNLYGPTETTVWSAAAKVETGNGSVSIGRPIANTQIYILDARLQPLPIGVAGELYIGGDGVARGYLNRPALTAERFLPDPFGKPGARIYRTGDLARWRTDGTLECLGRIDHQVKIRGHRIELGEVEDALNAHPHVQAAVAVARPDAQGNAQLVAYLVTDDDAQTTTAELRRWLKNALPEPMIPSAFVLLDALPLTPNGKVDRNALPNPDTQLIASGVPYEAPRNQAEALVAQAWEQILKRERVSIHDNFFELGGHSLLATQVVSRLRDAFDTDIPLRTLFEATTVAALAQRLDSLRQGKGAARTIAPPIVAGPRSGSAPASLAQQSLWFLDRLAPGRPTFNINGAARLKGPLDVEALDHAFNEIVRRHDALRTTFAMSDGSPIQVIAPARELRLAVEDLCDWPEQRREAEAERLAHEEARRPFDLAQGPLVRAVLLRLGDHDHVLLLTMHHIVTDGWSFGVAVRELTALYEANRAGLPSPLPELPIQYADFATWQRNWLQGDVLEDLIGYWTKQLAGVSPLELPTDRPRPAVRAARGANRVFAISPDLTTRLEALGRREGATTFMVLLAAFQTLLHRYSGQDDFAVGTPIANRNRAEIEGLIGFFVNMLALRADLAGDPSFRELLGRVRQVALEAYEHQDLSLDKLIEVIQPPRDLSRTPLFQVMFVLQNAPMPDIARGDLTLEPLFVGAGNGTAKFDLTLALEESGQGLAGGIEYNTELFDEATIARMLDHFQVLLEAIATDPEQRLSRLPILTESEHLHLVGEASRASIGPAPTEKTPCIHQRFEEQAEHAPEAVALVSGDAQLSYGALERRANQLARHLRALGAEPEHPVAIAVADPFAKVVSLLGVLKAGGAYLPLDPTLPKQRLASILDDAQVRILVTDATLRANLPSVNALIVDLDTDQKIIADQPSDRVPSTARPANLAYIISTSGSLGQPKGVGVSHASLSSAFHSWKDAYRLDAPGTRHLQMANFAFDVFTGDWVRALGSGGTLVFCPRETLLDPPALYELMVRERVTCAEFVPTVIENLLPYLEVSGKSLDFLQLLVVGSDLWHAGEYERLRRLAGPATRIVNSYGLTEATIDSTFFEGSLADRPANRPVPIGRPLSNSRVFVLDRNLQPVPVGVPGELHVGGLGLARGYHRRPALTASAFVPNPFAEGPGERLYKTGDLARWLPDGHLELLGRIDHQVKVRGFRIELAEVEAALVQHPDIREAVAAVAKDKSLVAYVVPPLGHTIAPETLRRDLLEVLPRPMIPSTFVVLDALPQTSSGKVDRNALPPIEGASTARAGAVVAPRDDVERDLVQIWEDLLNVHPVGVTDDFFDLGGHSLLAVRLTARIEERFGRKLSLSTLFLGATIEDLAATLRAGNHEQPQAWSPLVPIRSSGNSLPFFCVHPIGGNVLCYHELARHLGSDRPFYGLQAAGLEGEQTAETRLDLMAARYIAAIREVQPEGPYHLGGWSLGGVVAFEMARQLQAQGEPIATLVLIDSQAIAGVLGSIGPISDDQIDAAFLMDLTRASGASEDAGPGEDWGDLVTRGAQAGERLAAEFGQERLERLQAVFKANFLALAGYSPEPFAGRPILIRAQGHAADGLFDATMGWGALATGGVTTHVLPGDHYSLLKSPTVEALAKIVEAEMTVKT
ncbi:amino acid adenylation domain-containing protein [Singulisphaera acidiphila]|uniref:Amino acid adenylation enzyme/thioester reductase family protein n=4 Tax=Singulisphaera acidiphila TaxID=466153 RepID=L0DQE7_SINAD|nr:non-ribosomal peptide synthetase [Singulisphaera acidiphila]AGA31110.1 amino acid adenylation enzyme/thioester reductase family protein [Singulisphaera acidiphila DSM 18658]